jgi:uncharacterized protein (DUF4415 family)
MPKRSGSSVRGRRALASGRRTRRKIDYSDIPESSPDQLKAMRRVGRPPLGNEPRQLIAIRVDARVLESFRKEARRLPDSHQRSAGAAHQHGCRVRRGDQGSTFAASETDAKFGSRRSH